DQAGEACRASFSQLIGAATEEIALLPSVSVGVATTAATLAATDEVLVAEDEFTSLLFPLLVAAGQKGAVVRSVPFERLADSVGAATRLVAFSMVQSQSGRTADLAGVTAAARIVGARVLVDATHAVPFVPIDSRVDYLVCAAYKHLLSPRGVAFLCVRKELWDAPPPLFANWRSASNPYAHYYGGPLDLAPNAARFDASLAWFSWAGAAVSLDLLCQWQTGGLLQHVADLSSRLAARLDLPAPTSSIVSVPVEDAEAVRGSLSSAGIKAAVRAGSVRLSPHVYNTPEQIDSAASVLARLVPHTFR
ncbi:MAG: aminotransferase class V-fold PLP-dependent enzyme, partial [Chloroflexota bacterium]